MTETFAALLLAHALADFVFQTRRIALNKHRLPVLLLHGAVVLALAQGALGRVDAWEVLALALAHVVVDGLKARLAPPGLGAFLADQAAHLAMLGALAFWRPDLWAGGAWAGFGWLPALLALVAGAILVTRAGGFAVGFLMAGLSAGAPPEGLPRGGLTIGLLERGLIYVLMLAGQPEVIGFLIAAKSILRFGAVNAADPAGNRAASEYIIIGTLASFGWAILVALGVQALVAALP
ncbi:DUF3307 domain-containing protein [Albidovulum sp.]|uniref:DUF3307 domain-containing protein n=1 Tax=Albidovulum sp. TaxID=1872424 RepID=UPI0039B949AD